jgi:hypothetical protein
MFLKETLYSIDSLGIFRNIEMVKRLLVYERFFLKYSYSDAGFLGSAAIQYCGKGLPL